MNCLLLLISISNVFSKISISKTCFLPFRWMLWLLSVTSVSSMALEHCFALRHCTLHPHPLLPRQVPQSLGTGTAMVTGRVKGWPWGPTARPHREEKCVTWVDGDRPNTECQLTRELIRNMTPFEPSVHVQMDVLHYNIIAITITFCCAVTFASLPSKSTHFPLLPAL